MCDIYAQQQLQDRVAFGCGHWCTFPPQRFVPQIRAGGETCLSKYHKRPLLKLQAYRRTDGESRVKRDKDKPRINKTRMGSKDWDWKVLDFAHSIWSKAKDVCVYVYICKTQTCLVCQAAGVGSYTGQQPWSPPPSSVSASEDLIPSPGPLWGLHSVHVDIGGIERKEWKRKRVIKSVEEEREWFRDEHNNGRKTEINVLQSI